MSENDGQRSKRREEKLATARQSGQSITMPKRASLQPVLDDAFARGYKEKEGEFRQDREGSMLSTRTEKAKRTAEIEEKNREE